jgi:hypothetical protein
MKIDDAEMTAGYKQDAFLMYSLQVEKFYYEPNLWIYRPNSVCPMFAGGQRIILIQKTLGNFTHRHEEFPSINFPLEFS